MTEAADRGKGAHALKRARIIAPAALIAALLGLAGAAPAQTRTEAGRARAQLEALRGEIARITRQVSRGKLEQNRLTRELRVTERSAGAASVALREIDRRRAAAAARLGALEADKRRREALLAATRRGLAAQMRAAYLIGREEPLKLLLNQGDPGRAGRMFVYYSFFSRARARQISAIESDLARLRLLDGQLEAQSGTLTTLAQQKQAQLLALEQAKSRRLTVLASIAAATRSRGQRLALLRRQQSGLEALLRRLRRAMQRLPAALPHAPFAQLKGRLPWPVEGRVLDTFGEERAGALRWDGDLIATRRDAPVRAVCAGRVIYADWLAGLGLLIIVDHGDGYMSLYGHNARLYRSVGEWVHAGETIAAAGNTGGSPRSELYFGLRRGTRPLDPNRWLRPDPR